MVFQKRLGVSGDSGSSGSGEGEARLGEGGIEAKRVTDVVEEEGDGLGRRESHCEGHGEHARLLFTLLLS
jgi:hypothetical protein